jgi:hypothetical protein
MKGLTMKTHVSGNTNDAPQLRILQDPEAESGIEVRVDLEQERKKLLEQVEAEEFWAGRNLAMRHSARKAA